MLGALDAIAAEQNRMLLVYGGDRTVEENEAVKGSPNSLHLTGQAVDVIFEGMSKLETADALFHSSARRSNGLRLIYHAPGAALPEHSHLDGSPGEDLREYPRGSVPRYGKLSDPKDHTASAAAHASSQKPRKEE